MEKVKFTTNIDRKLLEEIKIKAIKESKNVNEIIENLLEEYLKGENKMDNLEGKKVKDLSKEEREYLESIISGDYRGLENKLKIGRNEATIDFQNGLSVSGWIINTEEEWYYEMDEEATIYDPTQ